VPAEGEQAGLVAAHERLEGMVIPPPYEHDQAFVGLEPQQWRPTVHAGQAGWVM
jgi:hypothetical protein